VAVAWALPRGAQTRRILRVIPSYYPYITGPANQAHSVSTGLTQSNYETRVVTSDLGCKEAARRETVDGVLVERLPILGGFMQYHFVHGAWRRLCDAPADVIHVHGYRSYLADAAAVAARRRRLPLILQLHGTLSGFREIVGGWRRAFYYGYDALTAMLPTLSADRFIVSTQAEAEEARSYGLDMARVRIIPMGIDVDRYVFPDVGRNRRKIVLVGRLAENRNVEDLLFALAYLRDCEWTCAIVGGDERSSYASVSGYVPRLISLAAQLNIADRCTFVGPLRGEELRRAYGQAGIFAYTSRYENFGQTILEAAASGCALVSTRVGVATDLIRDERTGFLISHASPRDLAIRLQWLLNHPLEQAQMGEEAQRIARHEFSWPPIFRQYADVYEEAIQGRMPSAVSAGN